MELPTYAEAIRIMQANDISPLAMDGWAHISREQPELAQLLSDMTKLGKLSVEHVTGMGFLVGPDAAGEDGRLRPMMT